MSWLPLGDLVLGGPDRNLNIDKGAIYRYMERRYRLQSQMRMSQDMGNYGEETTTPGVAPTPEPDILTKEEGHVTFPPCPRIVTGVSSKGTRCYLCARQLDFFFERSPGDYSKVCSLCVSSHLCYDIGSDGRCTPRPEEPKLK